MGDSGKTIHIRMGVRKETVKFHCFLLPSIQSSPTCRHHHYVFSKHRKNKIIYDLPVISSSPLLLCIVVGIREIIVLE